jgi:hypothetical protein
VSDPRREAGGAASLVGGRRRIDRVLADDYVAGLGQLSMTELRARRDEADQEETDLSYLRRMLQARIDLIESELAAREGGGSSSREDLVARLTEVLSHEARPPARGLGRHRPLEPSSPPAQRRAPERLVGDDLFSDLGARGRDELDDALAALREGERTASAQRRQVQIVLDALQAEIARRYQSGEADVSSLLPPEPGTAG